MEDGAGREELFELGQRAFDLGQRQGESAELPGEFLRALDAAIGDEQPADVLAGEVLGDEFHGDTGTDEQRRVFLETREELLREVHGLSYAAIAEDLSPEDLKRDGADALPKLHGALLKNEQDVHLFEQLVFLDRRTNPQ